MADRAPSNEVAAPAPTTQPKRSLGARISRVLWDRDDKSDEERRFVFKLDCYLLSIAMAQYFVKYLSQANVANAYISGMQEGIGFRGNQYNVLLTMFTVGYTIGQFPGTLLMVRISPAIWLPTCEVIWTALVMVCAVAKNVQTLYALRFLIGLLEASAYPGMLWVLGSWYGPAELGKRVVFFQATSAIGTMFSGFLQTAVLNLHDAHGLAGWQWLFIMDGVICMPIAIAGYFLIPNTPTTVNPWARRLYLTDRDMEIAAERMARIKRAPVAGFSLKTFKVGFSSWVPWTFALPYFASVVALSSYAYAGLFLKAAGFSPSARNLIPTIGYGIQLVMAFIYSWTSDAIGLRWPVIAFGGTVALVGSIILSCWPDALAWKYAGFALSYQVTSTNALMLTWANELASASAEGRAITLGFLNTGAYVFNAWVPNLAFPASQAPVYKAGYKVTAALWAVYVLGALTIAYFAPSLIARARASSAEAEMSSGETSRAGSFDGDKQALADEEKAPVPAAAVAQGQTVAAPATQQA